MKALLRIVGAVSLVLICAAIPTSLHADDNQILTHGHGNENRTDTKPKDISVSPGLKNKRVAPAIPGMVNKAKGMVPLVDIKVAVTFAAQETNGTWRWNAMIQNIAHDPLPVNRFKLKVVQVLQLPNQTIPAGSEFILPGLSSHQKRGFFSPWARAQRANQLRLEIWDQRANVRVYDQVLALAAKVDPLAAPLSPAAAAAIENPDAMKPSRIAIVDGRYLGRGAWELDFSSSGMGLVPANTYEYTWVYKFSTGTDRFYTLPKDIVFEVPGNQTRTLLEAGQFYDANDCDCAALDRVEVTLREKESGREDVFDITVAIPNVEIEGLSIKTGGPYPKLFDKALITTTVTNHSYYNLMLGYQLEVRMEKMTTHGIVRERFTKIGVLMLPARNTNKDATLVSDLRDELPHLEVGDKIDYPFEGYGEDDMEVGEVIFYGALTISMPATAKCGLGRPLDFYQKTLFW